MLDSGRGQLFNDFKSYKKRMEERKGVVEWLNLRKYKYFITVTFRVPVKPKEARAAMKNLLKMVRNGIFGKNRKRDYLKGFIFNELQKNGNPHFHILVEDHPRLDNVGGSWLRSTIMEKARSITRGTRGKGSCLDLGLIDPERGIDFMEHTAGNSTHYLTKGIEYSFNTYDFLSPLTYYGFDEIDIF